MNDKKCQLEGKLKDVCYRLSAQRREVEQTNQTRETRIAEITLLQQQLQLISELLLSFCSTAFCSDDRLEARHPSEAPDHYTVDGRVEDVVGQETLTEDILHLGDTLKEARENVTRAQEKPRQRLKSEGRPVLRSLQGERALIHKVNIDHLKHCKEEGPGIPQKMKDVKKPMTRPSVPSAACPRTCSSYERPDPDSTREKQDMFTHLLGMLYRLVVINACLAVKVKDSNRENPRGQRL
ncbi:hypothetical protein KUCAC02_021950 [Chaenocephalus aceratus]|nr:hypothetical protein KUCAC02_021950 [Chaenocephalus aceratus]